MASAKSLIADAAAQCGWVEHTQIVVLTDFIDQANRVEPNFQRYLQDRVESELNDDDNSVEEG